MIVRTVAVNESGRRIGQDQTGAKLTNSEVDLLLSMRGEGMGYGSLAKVGADAKQWPASRRCAHQNDSTPK
jgi:hypothetical protein